MATYEFKIEFNEDTVSLVYFAEVYHVDVLTMFLLYSKFGKDLFLIFHMFAGNQVSFPKHSKMHRILQRSTDLVKMIDTGDGATEQEKKVISRLRDMFRDEEDGEKLVIEMNTNSSGAGEINIKITGED